MLFLGREAKLMLLYSLPFGLLMAKIDVVCPRGSETQETVIQVQGLSSIAVSSVVSEDLSTPLPLKRC